MLIKRQLIEGEYLWYRVAVRTADAPVCEYDTVGESRSLPDNVREVHLLRHYREFTLHVPWDASDGTHAWDAPYELATISGPDTRAHADVFPISPPP